MTTMQAINLYQITTRYFHNEDDAKSFIQEIESFVDDKSEFERSQFASKEDLQKLSYQIQLAKAESKTDIAVLKIDLNKEAFSSYYWLIPITLFFVTLLIIIAKA